LGAFLCLRIWQAGIKLLNYLQDIQLPKTLKQELMA
jgi:hypothetical protein